MEPLAAAHRILNTMLGHLGFAARIEEQESGEGACLQVLTEESRLLIGDQGERLDDVQYLVNRILQRKFEDPPRIRIDCEHYRVRQEESLVKLALELAARAKETGTPQKMRPLNAYHRRIVHNALLDDDGIETVSPRSDERMKRILIRPKS